MRVTQQLLTENAIKYMDENLKRLYKLQEKVASGKEFQNPSDNPSGVAAAFSLRSTLTTSTAYLDSIANADSWMTTTDFSLNQAVQLGTRAINLARQGGTDTVGDEQRSGLATEIDIILQQAVNVANSTHEGKYIFGGFKTQTPPFSLVDNNSDGQFDDVVYNGGVNETITRSLSPGVSIPLNIDGKDTFEALFKAMIAARDALRTNDPAQIQAAIAPLENALQKVNESMTTNGARQRQVRLAKDRLEKAQIELKSLLSAKEDTNMTEAISYLQHQQTVYQTVLEVGQRAISAMSLFDLLS
ncbi:MAG: flagellar hook-associated protein FlgL [Anaerolineales bacterium]